MQFVKRATDGREMLELSSGRQFDPIAWTIGINVDGSVHDGTEVTSGHDETIFSDPDPHPHPEDWTVAERLELAEYMVERWSAFRARLKARS